MCPYFVNDAWAQLICVECKNTKCGCCGRNATRALCEVCAKTSVVTLEAAKNALENAFTFYKKFIICDKSELMDAIRMRVKIRFYSKAKENTQTRASVISTSSSIFAEQREVYTEHVIYVIAGDSKIVIESNITHELRHVFFREMNNKPLDLKDEEGYCELTACLYMAWRFSSLESAEFKGLVQMKFLNQIKLYSEGLKTVTNRVQKQLQYPGAVVEGSMLVRALCFTAVRGECATDSVGLLKLWHRYCGVLM
jgi:hypothetical protein